MRNPHQWRTVGLLFLASGIVAMLVFFMLLPAAAGEGTRAALVVYGAPAVLFGAMGAFRAHLLLRAQEAIQRGDDVIARWHIDPAAWRAFLALEDRLSAADGALYNELAIRDDVPATGIDVIVGKNAIQIDDSIHSVPTRGAPEVTAAALVSETPDYVELQLRYPGGGRGASGVPRGPTRAALRFPVAPKSWRDARRVVAHFSGALPDEPDAFHGRGDGSDPEDLNTCIRCGFQTYRYRSVCPQCGGGMTTRRWSRRYGAVLIACGLAITGIMLVVGYTTVPSLLHPGQSTGGTRFSGTRAQSLMVLAIFGIVTAFGLTALSYGLWQRTTGKRDKRVAIAMLVIVGLLLIAAYYV